MSSKGGDSVQALLLKLKVDYVNKTPTQLKIIDVFLAFVMATAGVLLTYCILFGSFPFNAFLAAFIGCVGTFIMAGAHRPLYTLKCCWLMQWCV